MTPNAFRNPTNSTNPMNPTNSINTHVLPHRFAYLRPSSLNEALALLAEHPDATILAGGTNLIVDMKLGKIAPAKVIDIT
ncbi:MAG: FAD binding domain-containing protein, partial [Candidatus Bipolaricaulis sp.]|nr:FAD binding domain-containing protein [Candidatus Bipolaricaulis sp.]